MLQCLPFVLQPETDELLKVPMFRDYVDTVRSGAITTPFADHNHNLAIENCTLTIE